MLLFLLIPEEKLMHHWWKHQQKLMNADELMPESVEVLTLVRVGEAESPKSRGCVAKILMSFLKNKKVPLEL